MGEGDAAPRLRPAGHEIRCSQYDRVLDTLAEKLPKVAEHLDAARADVLAFAAFPKEIWRQIWSTNPLSVIRPSDGAFDQAA